jgi:hypothetical protein
MWENKDDYLNDPAYNAGAYGYAPGYSVSLHPYSSNCGSIARAQQNMGGVTGLTPGTTTSGTLTGQSRLDEKAY